MQNPSSSEEAEDLAQYIQSSEYILREKGHHVLPDKEKAGVWVFSMTQPLDEGTAQNLGLEGLESGFSVLFY